MGVVRLRARWSSTVGMPCFVLLGAASAVAGQTTKVPPDAGTGVAPALVERSAVEVADSLLAAFDMEGSYAALTARLEAEPDDFEARWRAARAALGFGITGPDPEARREWLRIADGHGRNLLRIRPDDPEALAWAAAAKGRRAMAEDGARTVANLAKDAWSLTGRLLAARPDHPLGNHVRGKLHQEVARLPAVKRFLARMFLGSRLVGQARWELAEEHLLRAISGDPGMVLFYLDLGETYRYQGKTAEAVATYHRGLAVPDRFPVDARFKSTMRRRLATLEGPPGTS